MTKTLLASVAALAFVLAVTASSAFANHIGDFVIDNTGGDTAAHCEATGGTVINVGAKAAVKGHKVGNTGDLPGSAGAPKKAEICHYPGHDPSKVPA